ncbi:MAG: endonuclease/exonuclease/phosphatase family protein [Bacteroidota bacterium]|jgi:endonuclease/exonuclease/phosphatase family metal-dependent hydrolase|nr:endonuclease/exonuclease/phosphatase family protein [Bacteroidota bacterium]
MALAFIRPFLKRIVIGINLLIIFIYLLGCLSPWINPVYFTPISFIAILMPYLTLILIFFIIFWIIVKPKYLLLSLIALVLSYQQIQVMFARNIKEGFNKNKPPNSWRIISWNVQSFNGLSKSKAAKQQLPTDLLLTIQKLSPDIVCLQEFNNANNANAGANHIGLFTDSFPYHFFSKDYRRNNNYRSGCIIFSKYPIIRAVRIPFKTAESLIYADIVKGNDTIRVFTTHLQSYKFNQDDYDGMEKIKQQNEEALAASKGILQKMLLAFRRRTAQAILVKNKMNESPYPYLICGDFNDVPNSFTYFHIAKNMRDAFLDKGFGIGRSFISLAPTLRIDYILATPQFNIKQFDMVDEDLSDHIMLVSDLELTK